MASSPSAPKPARPPRHLSKESAKWWRSVCAEYEFEPHHLKLLQAACETWDRLQQAREDIEKHGSLVVKTADGGLKAHPAVSIERDCRLGFARLVRELDLDGDAPDASRPPSIASNKG